MSDQGAITIPFLGDDWEVLIKAERVNIAETFHLVLPWGYKQLDKDGLMQSIITSAQEMIGEDEAIPDERIRNVFVISEAPYNYTLMTFKNYRAEMTYPSDSDYAILFEGIQRGYIFTCHGSNTFSVFARRIDRPVQPAAQRGRPADELYTWALAQLAAGKSVPALAQAIIQRDPRRNSASVIRHLRRMQKRQKGQKSE